MLDLIAFGAHPDDVELFAGGTIAKMGALGYRTGIVDMTRGELGTRGTPAMRAGEAKEAARILGVAKRENLRLPDGKMVATLDARLRVIRVIRKYRPILILVHYWEDRHPDHVITSRLVTEACHNAGLAKIKTGQERFRPKAILYFMLPTQLSPTLVVDVSEFEEPRLAAIQAYRSQLFDISSVEPSTYLSRPDFVSHVAAIHAYYGTLIGKRVGEGFYFKGTLEVNDLVDFLKTQGQNPFI